MSDAPTADYYERIKMPRGDRYGYVCPTCDGAQYLRYERPVGDPLFGQITPCPKCSPPAAATEAA